MWCYVRKLGGVQDLRCRNAVDVSWAEVTARIDESRSLILNRPLLVCEHNANLDDAITSLGYETSGLEIDYCIAGHLNSPLR